MPAKRGSHRPGRHVRPAGLSDRRGEFDGFLLETKHGTRRFESRELGVESLVRRAWARRTLVAVFSERHRAGTIGSILLLEPSHARR